MIKSEDEIKRRGDFVWSVVNFSFEKDTIGHIFTGQYYGLEILVNVLMAQTHIAAQRVPMRWIGVGWGQGWGLCGVCQVIIRKEYLWTIIGKTRLGKAMPLARLKPPLVISEKDRLIVDATENQNVRHYPISILFQLQ